MGNRSLADGLNQQQRMDNSATGKLTTTTAIIWGRGRVLGDGSPARGFYIDEDLGPVVQAVPKQKYQTFLNHSDKVGRPNFARLDAKGDPNIKVMSEKQFAAANVRLFQVTTNQKADFNEMQSGAQLYEMVIMGEFFTETVAYPVKAMAARTLESTVPDGESLRRRQVEMEIPTSPRERIARLRSLRTDDSIKTEKFVNAGKQIVEKRAVFPKEGDQWLGSIKTNPKEGSVAIYRGEGSESRVLKADGLGDLKISASNLEFDADFKSVSYSHNVENSVQEFGSSNAVTPVPRFQPTIKKASWISGLYQGLMDTLRDSDQAAYGVYSEKAIYDYQVIDLDSYNPEISKE